MGFSSKGIHFNARVTSKADIPLFEDELVNNTPTHKPVNPTHKPLNPTHKSVNSPDKLVSSPDKLISSPDNQIKQLTPIALLKQLGKRAKPSKVQTVIVELCKLQPMRLEQIADLLKRNKNYIQDNYLNPLIKQGILEYVYPNNPTHPQQAYRTKD